MRWRVVVVVVVQDTLFLHAEGWRREYGENGESPIRVLILSLSLIHISTMGRTFVHGRPV